MRCLATFFVIGVWAFLAATISRVVVGVDNAGGLTFGCSLVHIWVGLLEVTMGRVQRVQSRGFDNMRS